MCTVSWAFLADGGYTLLFNRDELRSRRPASRPAEREIRGRRFLAPLDGDHGGTWVLVNEGGLTLGLLNHYPPGFSQSTDEHPSRGLLLMECADVNGRDGLVAKLVQTDLRPYPPFRLLGIDATGRLVLMTWNGTGSVRMQEEVLCPLISSSFQPEEVARYRMRLFPKKAGLQEIEKFHHQHDPTAPAHSVLMSREDACTHSITRIKVLPTKAVMVYEPQPVINQPLERTVVRLSLVSR